MILDELDNIVQEDMTTNLKIGYLAEICVRNIVKKLGVTPIQNWCIASYGMDNNLMIAINIRHSEEEESLFVRDFFLKNGIPVLGFVYDFSKDDFDIYEERSTSYIPITKETLFNKYTVFRTSNGTPCFQDTQTNIEELKDENYASFVKSLSSEEVKNFYISKNKKIQNLVFNYFEKIIDLDFCYILDNKLWIVDVKNKCCKKEEDSFILQKGESVYYSRLLDFENIGVQLFVIQHEEGTKERENFVKNMMNKKEVLPILYIKKLSKNWIYSGTPDIINRKNVLKFSWSDFTYLDSQLYIDELEIKKAIYNIPNKYDKCVAYLLKNTYLFLVGKYPILEALRSLKNQKVSLNEKTIVFVPRHCNEFRENWNVFLNDNQRYGIVNGDIDIVIFYEVNKALFEEKKFEECFKVLGYVDKNNVDDFYFIPKEYALSQTNFSRIKNGLAPVELAHPKRKKDMYFFDTKRDPYGLPVDFESILY